MPNHTKPYYDDITIAPEFSQGIDKPSKPQYTYYPYIQKEDHMFIIGLCLFILGIYLLVES